MRVRVGVNTVNADRNAAYFGPGRGVTTYGHTADFRLPYDTQVQPELDELAVGRIGGDLDRRRARRGHGFGYQRQGCVHSTGLMCLCALGGEWRGF